MLAHSHRDLQTAFKMGAVHVLDDYYLAITVSEMIGEDAYRTDEF